MHRICPKSTVETLRVHEGWNLFEVPALQKILPAFLDLFHGEQIGKMPVDGLIVFRNFQTEIILDNLDETIFKIQDYTIDVKEATAGHGKTDSHRPERIRGEIGNCVSTS